MVAEAGSELTRAAKEGRFGTIASPGDPDQLAGILRGLAEHEEKRQALGEAGRRYVEQFELSRLLHSFEEELRNLAEPSHTSRTRAGIAVQTPTRIPSSMGSTRG
jgi:hypothetical protein